MSTPNAIRDFLAPLLPGFVIQYGVWTDDPVDRSKRFAVLRPAGGGRAELLRTPQYTLTLIGSDGSDPLALNASADAVIEAMRAGAGGLVYLEPSEPIFMPTDDRRPVLEFAVSAITH